MIIITAIYIYIREKNHHNTCAVRVAWDGQDLVLAVYLARNSESVVWAFL